MKQFVKVLSVLLACSLVFSACGTVSPDYDSNPRQDEDRVVVVPPVPLVEEPAGNEAGTHEDAEEPIAEDHSVAPTETDAFPEEVVDSFLSQLDGGDDLIAYLEHAPLDFSLLTEEYQRELVEEYEAVHGRVSVDLAIQLAMYGVHPDALYPGIADINSVIGLLDSTSASAFLSALSDENKTGIARLIILDRETDSGRKIGLLDKMLRLGALNKASVSMIIADGNLLSEYVYSPYANAFIAHLDDYDKSRVVTRILQSQTTDVMKVTALCRLIDNGLSASSVNALYITLREEHESLLDGVLESESCKTFMEALSTTNKKDLAYHVVYRSDMDDKALCLTRMLDAGLDSDSLYDAMFRPNQYSYDYYAFNELINSSGGEAFLSGLGHERKVDAVRRILRGNGPYRDSYWYEYESGIRAQVADISAIVLSGVDSNPLFSMLVERQDTLYGILEGKAGACYIQGLSNLNKQVLAETVVGNPELDTATKANYLSMIISNSENHDVIAPTVEKFIEDGNISYSLSALGLGMSFDIIFPYISAAIADGNISIARAALDQDIDSNHVFEAALANPGVLTLLLANDVYAQKLILGLSGHNRDVLADVVIESGIPRSLIALAEFGFNPDELYDAVDAVLRVRLCIQPDAESFIIGLSEDRKLDLLHEVVNSASLSRNQKVSAVNVIISCAVEPDRIFDELVVYPDLLLLVVEGSEGGVFVQALTGSRISTLLSIIEADGTVEDIYILYGNGVDMDTILDGLSDADFIVDMLISFPYPYSGITLTQENQAELASAIMASGYGSDVKQACLAMLLVSGVDAATIEDELVAFISSGNLYFAFPAMTLGLRPDPVLPLIYDAIAQGDVEMIAVSVSFGLDSNLILDAAKECCEAVLPVLRDRYLGPMLIDGLTEEDQGFLASAIEADGTVEDMLILYENGVDVDTILDALSDADFIVDVLDSYYYLADDVILSAGNQAKIVTAVANSSLDMDIKVEVLDFLLGECGIDVDLVSEPILSFVSECPGFAFLAYGHGMDEAVIMPQIMSAITADASLADHAKAYGIDPGAVFDALLMADSAAGVCRAIDFADSEEDYGKLMSKAGDVNVPASDLVTDALYYGNMEFLESLLSSGVDISDFEPTLMNQLFDLLITTDDVSLACAIVNAGLSLDLYKWNLAGLIASGLDDEIVLAMIANGADVNSGSPMTEAAKYSSAAVVKALYDNGADPDYFGFDQRDVNGPLYYAILREDSDVLEMFVSIGADLNNPEIMKNAAFIAAVHAEKAQTIEILDRGGASFSTSDTDGVSALMYAAVLNPSYDVVHAIATTEGIDLEQKDIAGITALAYAALYGAPGAVNALLDAGADPMARDAMGNSVFDYVRANHRLSGTDAYKRILSSYRQVV